MVEYRSKNLYSSDFDTIMFQIYKNGVNPAAETRIGIVEAMSSSWVARS